MAELETSGFVIVLVAVFYGKWFVLPDLNIPWVDDILWVHNPGAQRSDFIVFSRLTCHCESLLEVSGDEAAEISVVKCTPNEDLEGEPPDFWAAYYGVANRGHIQYLGAIEMRTFLFQEVENELETSSINFQFNCLVILITEVPSPNYYHMFIWLIPWSIRSDYMRACCLRYHPSSLRIICLHSLCFIKKELTTTLEEIHLSLFWSCWSLVQSKSAMGIRKESWKVFPTSCLCYLLCNNSQENQQHAD